jgi:hypothetical protein
MLWHLVVHAAFGRAPFWDFELAAFAWRRLRDAFPEALAAVLMPNHVHLVSALDHPDRGRRRLAKVMSGVTRSGTCGLAPPLWTPVAPPVMVPDTHQLRRVVRYVVLNPCRARLAIDPLSWIWSTHRDVVGAAAEPWVTGGRLARVLGASESGFAINFHAYVSGDPSVSTSGTPAPRPAAPSVIPSALLDEVARAAAAAWRVTPSAIRSRTPARRLFVQLARVVGWRDTRLLADECGVTLDAVHRLEHLPGIGLDAGLMCLGDARLRQSPSAAQVVIGPKSRGHDSTLGARTQGVAEFGRG